MQFLPFFSGIYEVICRYRVHLFLFFLVLFIGMTLAHPAVFLNDEFISTNQVRQLHAGHQIIINEGKYGLGKDGATLGYFAIKGNILAYSLFLPLISIPAFWIIDLTGKLVAYLILVLWTATALLLLLLINRFFPQFSKIRQRDWTFPMVAVIFIAFFVNLFYFSVLDVDPVTGYPEILAIVFTNILLLSLSAVLIYEINRTIFDDPAFSFFGTMVCLFSSSCFLWSTFCKDHILVFACFVPFFFCLVRFIRTDDYWYLPLAFLFSGLMAWARPEVAFWIFLLTCGICGYTLIRCMRGDWYGKSLPLILLSPLFTVIGALPFFFNNLLITKNPLIPVAALYLRTNISVSRIVDTSQSLTMINEVKSPLSVILEQLPGIPLSPVETTADLAGIFFYPANGAVSLAALVPLFLVMTLTTVIFLVAGRDKLPAEERRFIILSLLVTLAVFLSYANWIHILNTDSGISPDMRYLSPAYLSLIVIGLILLKYAKILPADPVICIKRLFLVCCGEFILLIVIVSLASIPYLLHPTLLYAPHRVFFSFYTLTISLISIVTIAYSVVKRQKSLICEYLIYLLCTLPFIWQVNETLFLRYISQYSGYVFWIPLTRVTAELFLSIVLSLPSFIKAGLIFIPP
jgi:hypothetical protein